MKSCCKLAYKKHGKKCPVCNEVLVTSCMVVRLAKCGTEGPGLGITISEPQNGTVMVTLDGRCYKGNGKDDGIREVPLETVTPIEVPPAAPRPDSVAKFYEE